MNVKRYESTCTIFEGKIVVSGGLNNGSLKSVEAYDNYEDKWTYLPDLIEEKACHTAVSKKMFIIGGYWTTSCEVFDS